MTKQRKEILNIIINSNKLLRAYDIYKKLKNTNLSTVYRALKYFTENNLINIIYINKTGYYFYINNNHFLLCENCLKITPICCHDDIYKDIINKEKFKVNSHDLIFYGICNTCLK